MTFKEARMLLMLDGWEEHKSYGTYFFNRGYATIQYNPHARPSKRASYGVHSNNAARDSMPILMGKHHIEKVMRMAGYE